MGKKEVKLGLKPMINLISSNQRNKIEDLVQQNRFDAEAVKYLLDNPMLDVGIFRQITFKFDFKDFYTSFEEYVCSPAARTLYEQGETSSAFHWFTDYPTSPEEAVALYNKYPDKKDIIFKIFFYRVRTTQISLAVKDRYTACLRGVYELFLERTIPVRGVDIKGQIFDQMYRWSQYVSKDFIEFTEETVGVEKTISYLQARVSHRGSYANIKSITELVDVYSYFVKHSTPLAGILDILDPSTWDCSKNKFSQYTAECKKLFDLFLAEDLEKNPMSMFNDSYGYHSREYYNHLIVMLYSESDSLINRVFNLTQKKHGLSDALDAIIDFGGRGLKLRVTKEISAISITTCKSINRAIILEKANSIEELLILKNEIDPFSIKIEPFSGNYYALENIQLDKFSDEDMAIIYPMIRWNRIAEYFDYIPFEFLMKHESKIDKLNISGVQRFSKFTTEEKLRTALLFKDRMSDFEKSEFYSNIMVHGEYLTEADAACLLRESDFAGRLVNGGNKNLDLKSILTLL